LLANPQQEIPDIFMPPAARLPQLKYCALPHTAEVSSSIRSVHAVTLAGSAG
jgi:hypothetical protein